MTQARGGHHGSRLLILSGALGVAIATLALTPATAAEREVVYDLTASADGLRVSVFAREFLSVPDLFDVGIPTAQATTNSSGSTGFAANPHPGHSVIATPDLVAAVVGPITGRDFDPPQYPLFVRSDSNGSPDASVEQPGYSLFTKSSPGGAEARATAGFSVDQGSAARLEAKARTAGDPAAESGTAASEADVRGLTVNGVLNFGRIRSTASVEVSGDGKVTRSSDLMVADTTVGGQRVVITPRGVEAAGQTTPVPPPDALNQHLAAAGVSVRYLAPLETPNGIVSAGIEVTALQKDPTGASATTYEFKLVLGRTSAWADAVASTPSNSPFDVPEHTSDVPAKGAHDGAGADDAGRIFPDLTGTTSGKARIGSDAGMPAATPPHEGVGGATTPLRGVALSLLSLNGQAVYLALALAALTLLVGTTLARILGVRSPWES